jgi:hypothetical protein
MMQAAVQGRHSKRLTPIQGMTMKLSDDDWQFWINSALLALLIIIFLAVIVMWIMIGG